jgi:hypothetical protein
MLCFAFAAFILSQAQDSAKSIKAIIDARQYVFEPTNTTTGFGRLKQLTSGYFLQIKGDTLKTYLPYFGKAYTAPINSSDAAFDFTSTNFIYSVSEGKKHSFNISIKTKDQRFNTDFALTIYDNGSAYLRANNSNLQSVSYKGNVKEKNK